jgi:hypothetical protein
MFAGVSEDHIASISKAEIKTCITHLYVYNKASRNTSFYSILVGKIYLEDSRLSESVFFLVI